MFAKRLFRITDWTLGIMALLILGGFLWLRQSPYWAGITLFAEDYRMGADETSPFTSCSMAKSVISALTGIALDEGHIASIRDPIGAYVPALHGTAYGAVPIEDALTMSSGVGFDEDYARAMSDINMLFIRAMTMGRPQVDMLAGLESNREPGTFNDCVSSDTMALGRVLEVATGRCAAVISAPPGSADICVSD